MSKFADEPANRIHENVDWSSPTKLSPTNPYSFGPILTFDWICITTRMQYDDYESEFVDTSLDNFKTYE